jgi:hypothetical protein
MSDPTRAPAAKVRRHLMDPGNPRPQNREPMSLSTVQKWVLSTLAATTIMHLAMGLVVAAAFADELEARIVLLVIAGAFGVIAMVSALLIHRHRLVSTWLLLGLVPAAVGAVVIF